MSEVGVGDLVDGKYRIIRLIGEGGWGVVYEAENARTLKHVAVKLLRPRPELSDDIRMRFEREAQAAGRIGSEHIVEVFDLGTLADGTHYMVMELLHGHDLATRLEANGPLDAIVAAKLVVQLLDGLSAAHDAGILHRDSQAREFVPRPDAHRRRLHQDTRLRDLEVQRTGADERDDHRRRPRKPRVHGAGAGARLEARRRPDRSLLGGSAPLRVAHRTSAVHGRQLQRPDVQRSRSRPARIRRRSAPTSTERSRSSSSRPSQRIPKSASRPPSTFARPSPTGSRSRA